MLELPASTSAAPAFRAQAGSEGITTVILTGHWTLHGLAHHVETLTAQLQQYGRDSNIHWDLRQIESFDSVGAFVLWRANAKRLPAHLELRPEQLPMFRRWTDRRIQTTPDEMRRHISLLAGVTHISRTAGDHVRGFLELLGQFCLDIVYLVRHPRRIPWREISATIYGAGAGALSITALVGLLIGIVMSYLSALQLESLGAPIFIVNILGTSIVRELGPVLAAVLVAGRSGSAMAARLGVMRITQELDAMAAMGISRSLRLVLPKIVALIIVLPLLTIWTSAAAILGGMFSAHLELGISYAHFLSLLPAVVPVSNFWIGIGKSAVFGLVVALVACHFGLRIKSDTESLGVETTNSVVAAITMVILTDAGFAILFNSVGL